MYGERIYVVKLDNENTVWRRHINQLLKIGDVKEDEDNIKINVSNSSKEL